MWISEKDSKIVRVDVSSSVYVHIALMFTAYTCIYLACTEGLAGGGFGAAPVITGEGWERGAGTGW